MGTLTVTSLLIALVCAIFLRRRKAFRVPLPPSPPADPILGHLRYIPPQNPELQYTEWAKTYGDVIYLRVLNRSMVVLNSAEAAADLLGKRGSVYSDRPNLPIFNLMGWGSTLAFQHYGKVFQKHRRLLKEYLSQKKVEEYKDLQTTQARQLALRLARGKQDREDILRGFGTSVAVRIAFGHDSYSENLLNYNDLAAKTGDALLLCGPAGGTPIDFFPILQHFPSWFPGTLFANRARGFYSALRVLWDYPFEQSEGRAKPSFLSYHLERLQQDDSKSTESDYELIKGAGASIFSGGSDTIWATLSVFILAMVLHPECQKRAQQELDNLLLGSRLPELGDRSALPYIECIVQETYRWLTVGPLGVPHRALCDDVYKGMFIPKGATVIVNAWAISRDKELHHDADSFNPSRYQPKTEGGNGESFPSFHFGYGRRECPGRYLADGNFWIAVATILSLFKIERVKNAKGEEIIPSTDLCGGLISHPKPYKCNIRIRDDKAKILLQEIEERPVEI